MELALNIALLALFIRLLITSRDKDAEPTGRIIDAIYAALIVFMLWVNSN